jgi:hypothetical protein
MGKKEDFDLTVGLKYRSTDFPCADPYVFGPCIIQDVEKQSVNSGMIVLDTFFRLPKVKFIDSETNYENIWLPPVSGVNLKGTKILVGEDYITAEARLVNPLLHGKRDIFVIAKNESIAQVYCTNGEVVGVEEERVLDFFMEFYKNFLKSDFVLRNDLQGRGAFAKARKLEGMLKKQKGRDILSKGPKKLVEEWDELRIALMCATFQGMDER